MREGYLRTIRELAGCPAGVVPRDSVAIFKDIIWAKLIHTGQLHIDKCLEECPNCVTCNESEKRSE